MNIGHSMHHMIISPDFQNIMPTLFLHAQMEEGESKGMYI